MNDFPTKVSTFAACLIIALYTLYSFGYAQLGVEDNYIVLFVFFSLSFVGAKGVPESTAQVRPREAVRMLKDRRRGTLGYNGTPVNPCSRSQIHDPIRSEEGLRIVLHHDEGVSQIPQTE